MTKLFSNYKRAAIDFASAQGNYLTDTTGKTYLDFSSGIEDHKRYAMITRDGGETCKVILELDDALANTMKNSAPSKVFLD